MMFKFTRSLIVFALVATLIMVFPRASRAASNDTTRISVASDGTEGNAVSENHSISGDGRYVAFDSYSNNLVAGDTNETWDVFVRDTQSGTTSRVSLASDGTQGNGYSLAPAISGDGQYVVYYSNATNLVTGDNNKIPDIFMYDVQTATTTRISVASDGTEGNNWPTYPSISSDGRYVVFGSSATNLVIGDVNAVYDIFLHDTHTGKTTLISVSSDGTIGDGWSGAPSISLDGRYVAFSSAATNLVADDTNEWSDVFVHDIRTGVTTRVSVSSSGMEANKWSGANSISGDGRFVAFSSDANNLVIGDYDSNTDIFLHDTHTGATTLVSVSSGGAKGNDYSDSPSIVANGRFVVFQSYASNLVAGDTNGTLDIFLRDTQNGETTRLSVASDGAEANRPSYVSYISGDGRYVSFKSEATNFVDNDTNSCADIFVHENNFPVNVTAPAVVSVLRNDLNPTALSIVNFKITFSKPVTGVDLAGPDFDDFTLTASAGISDASISAVSGAGTTYIVTANTGSGNGIIRLDVGMGGAIVDMAGNPLVSNFTTGETYHVIKSATFVDVPLTYWANPFIERLYFSEITGGCGSGYFCPNQYVTRAQMAVFILRVTHGSGYVPPAATGLIFADVTKNSFAAAWIERLYAEGITGGCGGGKFCPNAPITRAEMSVFLLKAMYGPFYTPPVATGGVFADVPADGFAAAFIEQLVADGVTGGCGGGKYCPNAYVTRAEMAVFLVTAFDLP